MSSEEEKQHQAKESSSEKNSCCSCKEGINYCQPFIDALAFGRTYFTDNLMEDYIFCLLNSHTFISMFACLPGHPLNRLLFFI